MQPSPTKDRLRSMAAREWAHLTTFNQSDRPWQMPLAAGLAVSLPLFFGAAFNNMPLGLAGSLGGLVFVYLPRTPLQHRMIMLMACAFGLISCFALGLLSHLVPALLTPALTLTAVLVTMVCRVYQLGPPGSLFFVMAAALAADTPGTLEMVPAKIGVLALGAIGAALIALVYSYLILRIRKPLPVIPIPPPTFDFVVFDSIVIGMSVGVSLLIAQSMNLDKAYWVAVSCLAVIQGTSVRTIWEKQIHRILGTGLGLLLTWLIFSLPLNPWMIATLVLVLFFVIETLVVRHYGIAVVFITPMTILLGEAAHFPIGDIGQLIDARFNDTVLGSVIGFLGGMLIHSPGFRNRLGPVLRNLLGAGKQAPPA